MGISPPQTATATPISFFWGDPQPGFPLVGAEKSRGTENQIPQSNASAGRGTLRAGHSSGTPCPLLPMLGEPWQLLLVLWVRAPGGGTAL